MGRLLTTKEAAKIARNADGSALRKAIKDGKLKAIKPGHDWLIDEDDLRAWIDSKRTWKAVHPPRN